MSSRVHCIIRRSTGDGDSSATAGLHHHLARYRPPIVVAAMTRRSNRCRGCQHVAHAHRRQRSGPDASVPDVSATGPTTSAWLKRRTGPRATLDAVHAPYAPPQQFLSPAPTMTKQPPGFGLRSTTVAGTPAVRRSRGPPRAGLRRMLGSPDDRRRVSLGQDGLQPRTRPQSPAEIDVLSEMPRPRVHVTGKSLRGPRQRLTVVTCDPMCTGNPHEQMRVAPSSVLAAASPTFMPNFCVPETVSCGCLPASTGVERRPSRARIRAGHARDRSISRTIRVDGPPGLGRPRDRAPRPSSAAREDNFPSGEPGRSATQSAPPSWVGRRAEIAHQPDDGERRVRLPRKCRGAGIAVA